MGEKIKDFYKKHSRGLNWAAAFLLPFLLCGIILAVDHVYPFGDRCILHVDMYHQYCPFYTEFLDKLQQGGNLMYSWTSGLGSDFVAQYAYYLASPLNWLLILCPRGLVIEFMTLMILMKIGFSGFSFYRFLEYRSGEQFEKIRMAAALVFSTAYAMSGFVAAYSWDIMWMDCVALMPLTAMGLLKMIREGKPMLYYISLSVAIIANYYLAIMVCIFLVIYFVIIEIEEKGGIRGFLRFALYSALSGGTAAFLLIPEFKILSFSGSAGVTKPEFSWYFGILDELARACTTAEPYTGAEHWPNIYVGAFTLVLFVMYLLNEKISWKKKLLRVLVVFFFLLSFANSWLDFLWHGLHFPNSLPGREAFLFAFVMLAIGFSVVCNRDGIRIWHPAAGMGVWLAILVMAADSGELETVETSALEVTGIFLVCYGLLGMLLFMAEKKGGNLIRILACGLAVCELTLNMATTGFSTTSRPLYVEKQEAYGRLLEKEKELGGGQFWRTEDVRRKTKSDSGLYDYKSATQFSSLMNINVSHFYQRMYMEGGKNFYCLNGATPLLAAMLSVKYEISDNEVEAGLLGKPVAENGGYYLYENTYAMPLGFMVPADLEDAWQADRDKISNVNDLAFRLGAEGSVLTFADTAHEESEGSTTITAQKEGYYYAGCGDCSSDYLTISNSNGYTKKYSKTTHTYLMCLGYLHPGDTATITNANREEIHFTTYLLNTDAVDEAYKNLSAQPMTLTGFTDTTVEGNIEVEKAGSLFFSIPDQEGWTMRVDGEEVSIQRFAETFISTPLEKGHHTVSLSYRTPGLYDGVLISVICVGVFVVLMLIRRKNEKNDGTNSESEDEF